MKNILLLLALLICINTFSQKEKKTDFNLSKNTIYFEVGGLSMKPFSIHYDRILFTHKNIYFNTTIGYGFYPEREKMSKFSIPISFNLTAGKSKKNHFEAGVGITYSQVKDKNISNSILYSGIKLGYKYQSESPIFFKAGLNFFRELYTKHKREKTFLGDLHLIVNVFNLTIGYSF